MLAEIANTRQIPGEDRRRWFRDDDLDLIVWYDASDEISGFQLCYDTITRERALTWTRGGSYQHNAVDQGGSAGHMKMTPVLVADGTFDKKRIVDLFVSRSRRIELPLATFVKQKLEDYQS